MRTRTLDIDKSREPHRSKSVERRAALSQCGRETVNSESEIETVRV